MKKVLFINHCIYLPGEKAIKRTFYLFEMMRAQGYDVTFLTSDFNHYEKRKRNIEEFYANYPQYEDVVKFVHMKEYEKNISIKRFVSNYSCEKAMLEWYKKNGKDFDIIYVSWPVYWLMRKIRKYSQKFGAKIVLDVNDLWPDSLKMVLKNDFFYNLFTFKMQKDTKKSFSNADAIVAVSDEYMNLAAAQNKRATEKISVYIGAMLNRFDEGIAKYSCDIEKKDGEYWLIYVGTLGKSYDIDTVIKVVDKLRKNEKINIRLKILGQGPMEDHLRQLTQSLDCDGVDFIGFVNYETMAAYLNKSDACMNCIKQRASQSIINKIADYFASGRPVLNCGSCVEMANLIEQYNSGFNYEAENEESLKKVILQLLADSTGAMEKGQNARKLAELKFDREKSHQQIIELIDRL